MAMRRWFSRNYGQPPNSPLFDSQTLSYWQTHLVADQQAEIDQLKTALTKSAGRTDNAAKAWRQQVQERLAALGDRMARANQGQLAEDLAATERGELPAFMRRGLARPPPETDPRG